jgi:hypothetical protein
MKQIFGKRRVTRTSPGGVKAQPFCRLGALVFQLNNSEKIILGEPSGSDPDSRLCLKPTGFWSPAGKTLSPKAAFLTPTAGLQIKETLEGWLAPSRRMTKIWRLRRTVTMSLSL